VSKVFVPAYVLVFVFLFAPIRLRETGLTLPTLLPAGCFCFWILDVLDLVLAAQPPRRPRNDFYEPYPPDDDSDY